MLHASLYCGRPGDYQKGTVQYMSKVLVVVDMQNDFVNGSLGSEDARGILPKVKEKISEYQKNGDIVIFTRDTHGENYLQSQEGKYLPVPHCIYGTDGWKIVDGLDVEECQYIDKPNFGWPHWEKMGFDDKDGIELIGVCTDICVVSNALILKAIYPEIPITVDASCCAGVTSENHKAALLTMKSCQINVINE